MMFGAGAAIASVINSYSYKSKQSIIKYTPDPSYSSAKLPADKQKIIDTVENELADDNRIQSERICPECRNKFSLIKVNDMFFDACHLCHSIWFDFGELKNLTGLQDDIPANNLKEKLSEYKCPVCSDLMNKKIFLQKSNLIVDICIKHGIYLEKGELKRAFELC
ncbi:MAG: zf-TFIIB domain-containing protein [Spirochaetes bacterium]|nr:zf-TFIIB domain-containing protein [Spirochaetota bacterium]